MMKEMLASTGAKLITACVCPVVGAGAIALNVKPVREAVHQATAPKKPQREARAKPRVRKREPAKKDAADIVPPIQTAMMCSQPMLLSDAPFQPVARDFSSTPAPVLRIEAPSPPPASCPPVQVVGGGMFMRFAAVPEPASWAQMIAGFGLLGGTMRMRRHMRVTGRS